MATPIPDNTARFTPEQLSKVLGAPVAGTASAVRGVVTDSRRAGEGQLYVALRGERHDGHDFLPQVAAAGAAAVVQRDAKLPDGLTAYAVDDPLLALGALSRAHRMRWPGRALAITGSAGKTTTKELTAAALQACALNVVRTKGNLNNRIGVPMTLLTLDPGDELAVVEAGTSLPGEIAQLTQMIAPDVAVVTAVAVAHAKGLGSLDAVADEKFSIYDGLRDDGVAVFSADSPELRVRMTRHAGTRLSFGLADDADVRLLSHTLQPDLRLRCTYRIPGFDAPVQVVLQMLGIGPALDAGAALCCVLACEGADAVPAALRGLASQPSGPGRLCVGSGPGGSTFIDDTYNANPASMGASLRTLAAAAKLRGGRAIAVLGAMGELGTHAQREHEAVGACVAELGLSRFIGCGDDMAYAVKVARAAGIDATHVPGPLEALDELGGPGALERNDVLLAKGSRSQRMERLIARLSEAADGDSAGAGEPDA